MDMYSVHYKENSFWEKLKKFAIKAGVKVIYNALLLYYVLQKPEVPVNVKAVIVGALGYLILPLDAIPDITPVVGFSDDFGAIMLAVGIASIYIDEEIKTKARTKLKDWFDNFNENEL